MIRICALDFDGVILESVGVKLEAFERLFSDEPKAREIARYFRQNNGLDRYTKFRHVWTAILARSYDSSVEEDLDARFNTMVLDSILRCPFVPGAEDFLRGCTLPLYIVSAMPLRDLKLIVEQLSLSKRFKRLYGAPGRKADQLRHIISQEGIVPAELVFIGDSPKDLEAVRDVGGLFIGRRNTEPFHSDAIPLLDDLRDLSMAIDNLSTASELQ
jgi:phosphoglycolate phosphatase-like HAD superfamily hydrolase